MSSHFVLLDKDESCPTVDLSNIGRPNGLFDRWAVEHVTRPWSLWHSDVSSCYIHRQCLQNSQHSRACPRCWTSLPTCCIQLYMSLISAVVIHTQEWHLQQGRLFVQFCKHLGSNTNTRTIRARDRPAAGQENDEIIKHRQ